MKTLPEICIDEMDEAFAVVEIRVNAEIGRLRNRQQWDEAKSIEDAWNLIKEKCPIE